MWNLVQENGHNDSLLLLLQDGNVLYQAIYVLFYLIWVFNKIILSIYILGFFYFVYCIQVTICSSFLLLSLIYIMWIFPLLLCTDKNAMYDQRKPLQKRNVQAGKHHFIPFHFRVVVTNHRKMRKLGVYAWSDKNLRVCVKMNSFKFQ